MARAEAARAPRALDAGGRAFARLGATDMTPAERGRSTCCIGMESRRGSPRHCVAARRGWWWQNYARLTSCRGRMSAFVASVRGAPAAGFPADTCASSTNCSSCSGAHRRRHRGSRAPTARRRFALLRRARSRCGATARLCRGSSVLDRATSKDDVRSHVRAREGQLPAAAALRDRAAARAVHRRRARTTSPIRAATAALRLCRWPICWRRWCPERREHC